MGDLPVRNPPPETARLMAARQLLDGFDINDEDTRAFLSSVIASGQVPQEISRELAELSLMRGVEEWEMLFGCATALRDRISKPEETSLVPFLGLVLEGGAGRLLGSVAGPEKVSQPRRKRQGRRPEEEAEASTRRAVGKSVSHFWDQSLGLENADTRHGKKSSNDMPPTPGSRRASREFGTTGLIENGKAKHEPFRNSPRLSSPWREADTPNTCDDETRASVQALSPKINKGRKRVEPAVKSKGTQKSPFFGEPEQPSEVDDQSNQSTEPPSTARKKPRPPPGTVSSLPIPPLSAPNFGLIQETLSGDPFRLLIAITFLIKTKGSAAIPVFYELMDRFPGPEALAAADPADIIALIRPLGLSTVRCGVIQKYARTWLERPPSRDMRYGVKNYPSPGDGRHVRVGEEFGAEDDLGDCDGGRLVDAAEDARRRALGSAWEIGHLTQGPYALDSWRIFCRDALLGRAEDWKGKGKAEVPAFQPEWMRVLPKDKELRACLRWMWMREGWAWDPLTGEREPLREEMRRAVDEGRVGYDDHGGLVISDEDV